MRNHSAPIVAVRDTVERIERRIERREGDRAMLVAISGIDGSGKGFTTAMLDSALRWRGRRTAVLHVDDWIEHVDRRFDSARHAEHFYERGIRLDEMFDRLVTPLRDRRSIRLVAMQAHVTCSNTLTPHRYEFDDVEIILLEGIFLLRRDLRRLYDFSIWIDCSYETALARALDRNQEGLMRDELIRDYHAIYYPAQRLHATLDRPRDAADAIIVNDVRLAPPGDDGLADRADDSASPRLLRA
jgi:uridine kinase